LAGLRFQIHLDGFIPEDSKGTLVAGIKIPTAFATKIPVIRSKVHDVKDFVASMERVLSGEELSLTAKYHICYHNETPPQPCEAEQDI